MKTWMVELPKDDGGVIALNGEKDVEAFISACRKLRFPERAPQVKQV